MKNLRISQSMIAVGNKYNFWMKVNDIFIKKIFFTDFENEPCEGESSICEGTCQCIPCSPLGQSSEPTSSTASLQMTSSSLETQ